MLKHIRSRLSEKIKQVLGVIGSIINQNPDRHQKIRQSPIGKEFTLLVTEKKKHSREKELPLKEHTKPQGPAHSETKSLIIKIGSK